MSKLEAFNKEDNAIRKNRMLFDWLRDDHERAELYDELRKASFPVLQFKSLLRSSNNAGWPNQDVYLLSNQAHVEMALKHCSVKPYQALDSGGRFMLGLDDVVAHARQNQIAVRALKFDPADIEACAKTAFARASVLPLKNPRFDLATELAEQAALRFIALLFGFRDTAHPYLQVAMKASYTQLVFQIIGRHFVSDSGLPPADTLAAKDLKEKLICEIREAAAKHDERAGAPKQTVIERLVHAYGSPCREEVAIVALGLVAGTIGNVCAAVSIAIADFFAERDKLPPLLDEAQQASRSSDGKKLGKLIEGALLRNPPAPFLARTSTGESTRFRVENARGEPIPGGAHLLLTLGPTADRNNIDYIFGGSDPSDYQHRCVGQYLAWPLTQEIVRQVLLLPGLSQIIDPVSGKPEKLKKRWGTICESYPMQFQRDRRLNLHPLHLVLPIKKPIKENAKKLLELTRAGAPLIEEALEKKKFVHSAYFMLVENDTHLSMMTVYDGDFDAYVEHFAVDVPLFDEQLKYLEGAPPTPTVKFPKEFVEWIKRHNRAPFGGYFYSAYPTLTVADVKNATGQTP
jgi:cytochrome P450